MTLDELDQNVAATLTVDSPDGRPWLWRSRRHRRRIMAACLATMPTNADDAEAIATWHARAQEKCGFTILTIIGMAMMSWLIQKLIDYLWERWKKNHPPPEPVPESWRELRTEAVLLLETENDA